MTELIYTFILTHISVVFTRLYVHDGLSHRSIKFHPALEHFMRFWLWLTTGAVSKYWVAIHRLHHQHTDREGDPHSPYLFGLFFVFLRGALLYWRSSAGLYPLLKNDSEIRSFVESYGAGTPDDWIERNLYTPYGYVGVLSMLSINLILFGAWGILIWTVQMLWMPLIAGFLINGLAHRVGYRNYDTKDQSKNLVPWGILFAGEELHHNHHYNPAQVKQSHKPWEFDLGWIYLKVFIFLRLAELTRERAI